MVDFVVDKRSIRRFRKFVPVGPDNECWPWTGHTSKKGYGLFLVINSNGTWSNINAHRFALAISSGSVEQGKLACHTCDNPPCCNPKHLFWGTSSDNLTDCSKKGRMLKGSDHHFSKRPELTQLAADRRKISRGQDHGCAFLTQSQVDSIRAEYAAGARQMVLAKKYGVWQPTISDIVRRVTWTGVPSGPRNA